MIRRINAALCWLAGLCATGSLFAGSGAALHFNTSSALASIPHNTALDAYPLTVSAWFRSAANNGAVQVIAAKYVDSTYDGWALALQSGQLRGFYYRAGSLGNKAIDTLSGTIAADGIWHYAALVVDTNGGRMFLDGALVASNGWTGISGAITNTAPLTFGNLANPAYPLSGDVDEVALWKRALTSSEINYLKHRQLRGGEDGLVGYWRLDEGGGSAVTDSTGHGFGGTLINSPQRISSGAAVELNVISTNCLKFDGTGDLVSVASASDLNAYPLTVSSWFRGGKNSGGVQVIAAKYIDSSFDGWALALQSGQLRGFYYSHASSANKAIDALSGTIVTDDGWHHAALVVDGGGGRLFLDGTMVASNSWTGTPGGNTNSAALTIGNLTNPTYPFTGEVDEIALWKRALSAGEIQSLKNLPLAPDPNLVAYWRLDEGTNGTTADATGNAHTGTLVNSPQWTGSTAYLGDGLTHLVAAVNYASVNRAFAIAGSPGQSAFTFDTSATLTRYYDYGSAPPAAPVSGLLDYTLQTVNGAVSFPLKTSETNFSGTLGAYLAASPMPTTAANGRLTYATALNAEPNGVQLDSVDNLHQLVVTLTHSENGGAFTLDFTSTSDAAQLFHFDGNLFAGTFRAIFTNLDATPVASNTVAGDHLDCSLPISANSGHLPGVAGYNFGNGLPLAVSLATNGDAILKSALVIANGPTNDIDTIQNISFLRSRVFLTTNGAAMLLSLNLPVGFSLGLGDATVRLTTNTIPFVAAVDASLRPLTNSLTDPGPLYFSAETLPCWLVGSALTWNVYAGQLVVPTTNIIFVRQWEDDLLTAIATNLFDTNSAKRISNDAYFRNAQPDVASPNFIVTADANGMAQLAGNISLQPPELRPHFPHTDEQPGSEIPTGQGLLALQNSLVAGNSFLNVTAAVPLAYGRDCSDTNCSGATASPALVNITPNASQLTFTPDGGLLGYGLVSSITNPKGQTGVSLMWGYGGGNNFAQQTTYVQTGVYHMPGNFLRGDQTALDGSERAAVLLFTGCGDDSNPAYQERPGTTSYADGFANYAGLNLRAPAQGDSIVANVDTGWYPLTARAKYYVRAGGVSGIHEAASFPASLNLYGYPFRFASYRLSYLDSENWESRTDGQLSFPDQPAGFTQEFQRMKFACSGGLDSAQLPPNTGVKHLNYWNADFTPQSIQFKPSQNENCSTANRYLVIGAEVRLPFIPEALHGVLGFKPNGNLLTLADNVPNAGSRFTVPGQLSLRGTGGSTFPLAAASEGYFNNWETTGHPDSGCFNLAGKITVPFFAAIKAHLHITPISSSTAQVDIMGGWPQAGSMATDRGWSNGTNNYFTAARFDPAAASWPGGIPVDAYRNSQTEQYHPRAQRNWHNLVFFDYPLNYNSALHQFEGFSKAPVGLPIVDVDSNLKSLTPGKVDLDFAQDINFKLPQIKGLDFLSDTENEINAPFNTISNAVYGELKDISDKSGLSSGFISLQRILSQNAKDFFDAILQTPFDSVASNVVATLALKQTTNVASVLTNVFATVAAANNGVQSALGQINGTVGQINSVFGKVNGTFTDVDNTLGLFQRILAKDPGTGDRHVVRIIVEKLVQDQSQAAGIPDALADNLDSTVLTKALAEIEPTLAEIQTELGELQQEMNDAHDEFTSATGGIADVLNSITNNTGDIQNFLQQSQAGVSNLLATLVTPTGDYFTADPAAARARIREQLETAFLSSTIPADYQKQFRLFFSDDSYVLDQLLTVLTDKINSAIRSSIENYISGDGTGGIYHAMKGIGAMQQTMFAAKITGQPVFNRDSLQKIHLDANIKLNLPNEMSFPVFMEISELNSQSGNLACIPAGGPAAEVTLGAINVPLKWPGAQSSPDLTLTANARWTLQNGTVIGIGGLLEVDGNASFEGATLKTIGATFAIGETENYFAAKADAVALIGPIPVEFKAGIFGGHSCSLDPLIYIDSNASNVLNNASDFSGIYLQFGGGLSLSQILLGTSSCALDAEANISTAEFFQGEPDSLSLGVWQKKSVEISLLCVLYGKLDFIQAGTVSKSPAGYQLTLLGSADLCGKLGPCPFCVQGCKTITIKGVLKQDGIDYFLDY
jgi:hypothetical protein